MKKLKLLLAAGSFALVAGCTVQAQTNTFFTTVAAYFSSFNTNYNWTNVTIEASTGYKQVTGVNASEELYAQYDIGNLDIDTAFQFSGVGSAINAFEVGAGYAFVNHFDTKAEVQLLAGYDNNQSTAILEPKLALKKKLTDNTYAETGLSLPIYFKGKFNTAPSIYIGVGFTY